MSPDDPFLRPDTSELQPSSDSSLPNDLIDELDQALENITIDTAPDAEIISIEPPAPDGLSVDPGIREMQETFLGMVRNFLRPVDRYMKAIAHGDNSRELLEIAEHIVAPLVAKTDAVGLREHTEDLILFRSLLQFALGERDSTSFESMKGVVVRGFEKLQQRFALERFRGSRPAVRNVVAFYRALKEEGKVAPEDLARFFAIGLPSVTWLRRTPIPEMVSLSGITTDVIRTIQRKAFDSRFSQGSKEQTQDLLAPPPLVTPEEVAPEVAPIETVDIDLLDSWEDISFGPASNKSH